MDVASVAIAVGTFSTAAAAVFAGWQVRESRRQARTNFEDGLTRDYRRLVAEIPVGAFLKDGLAPEAVREHLSVFYRYFDLSNEQAFLWEKRRISGTTWIEWRAGIVSNMGRQAFHDAWFAHVREAASDDFAEL